MLKYWSNAFMTIGAAVFAASVFVDAPGRGLFIGTVFLFMGAWFHWILLKKITGDET